MCRKIRTCPPSCVRYFPEPLRETYAEHMERHRLKREIIATAVTNSMVNRMGATFMLRMQEDTGQPPAAVAKAFNIAREVLDARSMWSEIESLDSSVDGNRADRRAPGDLAPAAQHDALAAQSSARRAGHRAAVARYLTRHERGQSRNWARRIRRRTVRDRHGNSAMAGPRVSSDFCRATGRPAVPGGWPRHCRSAADSDLDITDVAAVYYELGDAMHLQWLMQRIEELPVETRWHAHARGALRDELSVQHRSLAAQVLARPQRVAAVRNGRRVAATRRSDLKYTLGMFDEMRNQARHRLSDRLGGGAPASPSSCKPKRTRRMAVSAT